MDTLLAETELHPSNGPKLASVTPAPERMGAFALLRGMARNPMETWPESIYHKGLVRRRDPGGGEHVFVTDPDLLREILVEKPEQFIRTSETERGGVRTMLRESLLTTGGARWRWQRRTVAPLFRHERLLSFVPAIHAVAAATRDRWLRDHGGAEIDVGREMMRATLEIIVATMLPGAAIPAERIEQASKSLIRAIVWQNAYGLLRLPLWTPYPGRRRELRTHALLRATVREALAERQARSATTPAVDLLAHLAAARDPETGQAMDDEQVVDNLLTFILAGHETTALALTWTFYLLAHHPAWERALVEEIMATTGGGTVEAGHLDQLLLTRQVVQEAMRLYPPAPITGRITRERLTLGGQSFPARTILWLPIYAVHRHRALWTDPDRFDPGRFAPDAAQNRHRCAYLPFIAGPHTCIGAGFSMMEAAVVLATLLPAVSLALRPGFDPGLSLGVTLRPRYGMPMRVAARPGAAAWGG